MWIFFSDTWLTGVNIRRPNHGNDACAVSSLINHGRRSGREGRRCLRNWQTTRRLVAGIANEVSDKVPKTQSYPCTEALSFTLTTSRLIKIIIVWKMTRDIKLCDGIGNWHCQWLWLCHCIGVLTKLLSRVFQNIQSLWIQVSIYLTGNCELWTFT